MPSDKRNWRKKLRKRLRKPRRYIVYLLTLLFRRILLWLPFSVSFKLCESLGSLAHLFLLKERRKTLSNLTAALGKDVSKRELRRIAREVFRNAGRSLAEVLCWQKLGVNYLRTHVTLENPHHLLDAYKKGKGVIGLTCHFGNWEYLAAALANILRIRFAVIAREYSNPWLNRLLEETRRSMGVDVIYRGESGVAILRRLKRNEGLGILADQNTRGEGIVVNFFGRPAKTLRNVVELIARTGAPVVPLFIVRNKDLTTHRLIVENPLVFSHTNNEEENLKNIAEVYTQALEDMIRRHPAQWMWMHNRWG